MMLTKIFCEVYDFLKVVDFKSVTLRAEERKRLGRKQKMTSADIMTILIFFNYSKRTSFKDYYHMDVLGGLQTAFDSVVSYNRFLELIGTVPRELLCFLCMNCLAKPTDFNFIDATVYEVCNIKRALSHKVFDGIAKKGKTTMGWFFGMKLHLIVNAYGEIVSFYLTPGNVHDANKKVIEKLTNRLSGKLFGDRGYISQSLFKDLLNKGVKLVTRIKKNMQNKLMDMEEKILLRKRVMIESVFSKLKECFRMEHSRHRSTDNFLGHLLATLCAYKFDPRKPSIFTCPTKQIGST